MCGSVMSVPYLAAVGVVVDAAGVGMVQDGDGGTPLVGDAHQLLRHSCELRWMVAYVHVDARLVHQVELLFG
jgi:hypothetical protein